jgi:hypothetical protein
MGLTERLNQPPVSIRARLAAGPGITRSSAAFESEDGDEGFTAYPPLIGDSEWEPWLDYAQYRIKEAFQLTANWDLEGASLVTERAAKRSDEVAWELNQLRLPRPFVSATRAGGIGFEWSGGPLEVLLEINDVHIEVSVRDSTSGEFAEGSLPELGDALSQAFARLTR